MPRIFDNIAQDLLPELEQTLQLSIRSDFCVGYFNLRGWQAVDEHIKKWPGGPGQQISAELIEVIEQSWAREAALPPHQIYVKMAYRLAQKARAGLSELRIPPRIWKPPL